MTVKAMLAGKKSIFPVTILLNAILGAFVVLLDSPEFAFAGFLCLFFLVLLLLKLHWGIYVLLLVSTFSAIAFEAGPFTVRPDQVITLLLAAVLFIFLISGKRRTVRTSLDWLILAYLVLNIISSLVHAPDERTSLQRCAMLAITFTAYFVGTQLIRTPKILSNIVLLLLVVGVLQAIYGIVSVYLISKGVDIRGAYVYGHGDIYAKGTFLEGNIFGSFEMMVGLILLSFLFSAHFRKERLLILICLVVVMVASLMSFTRAAWLGFMMGSFAYLVLNRKKILGRLRNHLAIILVAFVLLSALAYSLSVSIQIGSVSLMDLYVERVNRILEFRSGTGSARVQVWKASIDFWRRNPMLGNGTDSIKALAKGTTIPKFGEDYWIPSSMILALHDTGIVGFLCFCAIQLVFLWRLVSASRKTASAYYQALLEGFFAAFIGVQFAYFFTNAFWLVFIWVFMAIGISCCRLAENASVDSRQQ